MIWIAYAHHDDGKRFVAAASANRSINGTERSERRQAAIRVLRQALEADSALELRVTLGQASRPAPSQSADGAGLPRC